MEPKTTFKRCVKCRAKLPSTDHHEACLLCLGEEHNTSACKICCAFSKQTRQNRALRLRAALYDEALRPPTPCPRGSLEPSTSSARGPAKGQCKTAKAGSAKQPEELFKRPKDVSGKKHKHRAWQALDDGGTSSSAAPESWRTPLPTAVQTFEGDLDESAPEVPRQRDSRPIDLPTGSAAAAGLTTEPGLVSSVMSASTSSPAQPSTSRTASTSASRQFLASTELAEASAPQIPSTSTSVWNAANLLSTSTAVQLVSTAVGRVLRLLSPAATPVQSPSTSRTPAADVGGRTSYMPLQDLLDSTSSTPSGSTFREFLSAGLDVDQDDEDQAHLPRTPSIGQQGAQLCVPAPSAGQPPQLGMPQTSVQPTHHCGFHHTLLDDYAEYLRWRSLQPVTLSLNLLPLQPPPPALYPPVQPASSDLLLRKQHPQLPVEQLELPPPEVLQPPKPVAHLQLPAQPPLPDVHQQAPIRQPVLTRPSEAQQMQEKPSGKRKRKSTPPPSPPSSPDEGDTGDDSDDSSGDDDRSRRSDPPSDVPPRLSTLPTEELKAYHTLIRDIAEALRMELKSPDAEDVDPVYNMMKRSKASHPVSLTMIPAISRAAKTAWETMSVATPTSKRLENLYRVTEKDNEYLLHHPVPNSLVIDCASTSKGGHRHTTLVDKEGRKMDVLGRKVYKQCFSTFLESRTAKFFVQSFNDCYILHAQFPRPAELLSLGSLQLK
ncbi:transmembrane protein 80 isoform X1 [Hemicordylus capensis]|uniref:transmembrane protein 80 isoform X1 n=1 Tax=Hemicordylus capensis TaxID=884348 RepID=UPI0023047218|nr:transmembrane protein 80 isoform X1 [Hemicordylus capensis]XP_053142365.1 transmembrane protein 80 isoform X1 [Hemicordylus capensis]